MKNESADDVTIARYVDVLLHGRQRKRKRNAALRQRA
jgi:hypothetical protein